MDNILYMLDADLIRVKTIVCQGTIKQGSAGCKSHFYDAWMEELSGH